MITKPRFGLITHFPKLSMDQVPVKSMNYYATYIQVGEDLFAITHKDGPEWAAVQHALDMRKKVADEHKPAVEKGLVQFLYQAVGVPNPFHFQMESPPIRSLIDKG